MWASEYLKTAALRAAAALKTAAAADYPHLLAYMKQQQGAVRQMGGIGDHAMTPGRWSDRAAFLARKPSAAHFENGTRGLDRYMSSKIQPGFEHQDLIGRTDIHPSFHDGAHSRQLMPPEQLQAIAARNKAEPRPVVTPEQLPSLIERNRAG